MYRRHRLIAVAATTFALALPWVTVPAARAATPRTFTIGVDHEPPAGHDFMYVDYFPRHDVEVPTGSVVDFSWGKTPDGLHTATLLKTGESPGQAWGSVYPLIVPDADDPGGQLQLNPAAAGPSFPPPGSGAPNACGDAASPCPFDATADVNSGANGTDGVSRFFVKMDAPAGTTVSYVCLIHPGMGGDLKVVGANRRGTSPTRLASLAKSQAEVDTRGALAAEAAADHSSTTFSNGQRVVHLTAGTATEHVEVLEMLPRHVEINKGDKVEWRTTTIRDIHTVTFPVGTDEAEPIPMMCEGDPDTPFIGAPGPPCGNPALFEIHFNPGRVGPDVIADPSTVASSGIIATPPAPFPSTYAASFPNSGHFLYFCHIHENGMLGDITVRS